MRGNRKLNTGLVNKDPNRVRSTNECTQIWKTNCAKVINMRINIMMREKASFSSRSFKVNLLSLTINSMTL